ncbi:MAG: rod-binding protein [Lachnospiraceae bacterium]|nr:rod-binding protein [Lachnospiraceae bacterium]
MDINAINSDYLNNVLNTARTNASGSDLQGTLESFQGILDAKKQEKAGEAAESPAGASASTVSSEEDKKLMEACKEFEAYFYEQVFKEMKKSVSFTDSEDAASKQLMDYYEDSLTSEYAKLAAGQQENGFAQMLYEQMKRNM